MILCHLCDCPTSDEPEWRLAVNDETLHFCSVECRADWNRSVASGCEAG